MMRKQYTQFVWQEQNYFSSSENKFFNQANILCKELASRCNIYEDAIPKKISFPDAFLGLTEGKRGQITYYIDPEKVKKHEYIEGQLASLNQQLSGKKNLSPKPLFPGRVEFKREEDNFTFLGLYYKVPTDADLYILGANFTKEGGFEVIYHSGHGDYTNPECEAKTEVILYGEKYCNNEIGCDSFAEYSFGKSGINYLDLQTQNLFGFLAESINRDRVGASRVYNHKADIEKFGLLAHLTYSFNKEYSKSFFDAEHHYQLHNILSGRQGIILNTFFDKDTVNEIQNFYQKINQESFLDLYEKYNTKQLKNITEKMGLVVNMYEQLQNPSKDLIKDVLSNVTSGGINGRNKQQILDITTIFFSNSKEANREDGPPIIPALNKKQKFIFKTLKDKILNDQNVTNEEKFVIENVPDFKDWLVKDIAKDAYLDKGELAMVNSLDGLEYRENVGRLKYGSKDYDITSAYPNSLENPGLENRKVASKAGIGQ
jgi:predicted RNase H-related nuclease YkuK (DUF458 family)